MRFISVLKKEKKKKRRAFDSFGSLKVIMVYSQENPKETATKIFSQPKQGKRLKSIKIKNL